MCSTTSDVSLARTGPAQITCNSDLFIPGTPVSSTTLDINGTLSGMHGQGVTVNQGAAFSSNARVFIPQSLTTSGSYSSSGPSAITTFASTSLSVGAALRVAGAASVTGDVTVSGNSLIRGDVFLSGLGFDVQSLGVTAPGVLNSPGTINFSSSVSAPSTTWTAADRLISATGGQFPGQVNNIGAGAIRVSGGVSIAKTLYIGDGGPLYLPPTAGAPSSHLNYYDEYSVMPVWYLEPGSDVAVLNDPIVRITRVGSLVTISKPAVTWTKQNANIQKQFAAVGVIPPRFRMPPFATTTGFIKVPTQTYDGVSLFAGYTQIDSDGTIRVFLSYDLENGPTTWGPAGANKEWGGFAVSYTIF